MELRSTLDASKKEMAKRIHQRRAAPPAGVNLSNPAAELLRQTTAGTTIKIQRKTLENTDATYFNPPRQDQA